MAMVSCLPEETARYTRGTRVAFAECYPMFFFEVLGQDIQADPGDLLQRGHAGKKMRSSLSKN